MIKLCLLDGEALDSCCDFLTEISEAVEDRGVQSDALECVDYLKKDVWNNGVGLEIPIKEIVNILLYYVSITHARKNGVTAGRKCAEK